MSKHLLQFSSDGQTLPSGTATGIYTDDYVETQEDFETPKGPRFIIGTGAPARGDGIWLTVEEVQAVQHDMRTWLIEQGQIDDWVVQAAKDMWWESLTEDEKCQRRFHVCEVYSRPMGEGVQPFDPARDYSPAN